MSDELKKELAKPEPKLTGKQLLAIAAIISEPSMERAARKAKVARCTLYRWLTLPAFKSEVDRGYRAVYFSALGKIQGACNVAVQRLIEGMNVRRKTERRLAAAQVLEFASRAQEEIEFVARISALEQAAGILPEAGRLSITELKRSVEVSFDKKGDGK